MTMRQIGTKAVTTVVGESVPTPLDLSSKAFEAVLTPEMGESVPSRDCHHVSLCLQGLTSKNGPPDCHPMSRGMSQE